MSITCEIVLESQPLAAGAAGTAYRGRLSDGTVVVVKLNRRGAEEAKEVNGVRMVVCNKAQEQEALRRLRDVASVACFLGPVALDLLTFGANRPPLDAAKFESPGLVLEYVQGPTLKSYLMSEKFWASLCLGPAGPDTLAREFNALMLQSLLSVADQADRGVVHLDWHFRNILVNLNRSITANSSEAFYSIKTIDYGLVKLDVVPDQGIQYFARKLHKIDQLASDLNSLPSLLVTDLLNKVGFRFSPCFLDLLNLQFASAGCDKKGDFFPVTGDTVNFLSHMAEEYAVLIPSLFARRKLVDLLWHDARRCHDAALGRARWTSAFLHAINASFFPKHSADSPIVGS